MIDGVYNGVSVVHGVTYSGISMIAGTYSEISNANGITYSWISMIRGTYSEVPMARGVTYRGISSVAPFSISPSRKAHTSYDDALTGGVTDGSSWVTPM